MEKLRTWHSHTVSSSHPAFRSARRVRASLAAFRSPFSFQSKTDREGKAHAATPSLRSLPHALRRVIISTMTASSFKIGKQEFVVIPRKDFDRLQRKAALLTDEDAADLEESIRRLNDPREKRIPWSKVKKRARLV